MPLPRIPRIPRVLRFFFAALLALVALPALAADEGLGNTVEPIVGARCRLFEVAADAYREEASDGIFPLKAAYGNRTPGILPEEVLKRCFDGTLERLPGIKLLWEDSFAATRGEAARFSVGPLPSATGRPLRLDLAASASFDDRANAAFFDVDFSLRPDGAGDDAPAVVLGSGKSQRVWWGGGYAVVARPVPRAEDSVPPYYLAVIGNWEHDGYRRVPVRPVGREVLDARYAEAAERGRDVLAEALCADFDDPARHGAALAWIAQAASALGSPNRHPPVDAPFLSDRDYVEALVAVGLAAFCESDWRDEVSFEAILGLHWTRSPRSLRAHALARYAGQGNPAPGPRTLPAWRVGRPNRFEGDSPEARRAALELARSLVVRSVFGERDIPSAAVVFGLFPEAGPRLAAIDRGDSLPRVAASPVPAIAERAPLVGRAIRRAEEAAEADAAGYPPVRHPPPGEVEGLFLLAAPDRDPPVFVAGEPIHFDVALSNAGPFVVSVEESTDWHEFRVDGLEPLEWRRPSPFPRGSELSRHFWWELFPGAAGQPDRIDLADWVSNAVPRRVSATLRRNLDLFGHRWAETRVEFEIVPAPATNAPAATPAAAFDTTLFAAFATNVPCWPPPESPSFDEVLHALPDFASFRTGRGWGVPTEPLPPELEAAVRKSLRRAVRTDTPPEALRFGTERETWPEDGWCVDAHWHTAAFEARFPGRGFCPFGHGSGGSYSERFLAYRSPDSAEDALFALFPGTYRAPGLAALLDRAHPPSGVAEETHAESAESESHAESAETAEP